MYKSIYYQREKNLIHLWDDRRGYQTFPYTRYAYERAENGEYTSIYGDRLTKVYKYTKDTPGLFESDVPEMTRVLVDTYSNSDEVSEGHTILTYDIEVEMETGLPDTELAENAITSIALHDSTTNKYYALIHDVDNVIQYKETQKAVIIPVKTEEELLLTYLDIYESINPTIVTGWNIDVFDTPYLYNRMVGVLGKKHANRLSPIGLCSWSKRRQRYSMAGVSYIDYMTAYKYYNFTELPNYRLDTVGKIELGKGKIEYDGNLDQLFREDVEKFIEYNLVDVELVVELDKKLQFIDLCRGICHAGHVSYEDFVYSSIILEGAILTYLRRNNLVAPNKKPRLSLQLRDTYIGNDSIYVENLPNEVPRSGSLKIHKSKSSSFLVHYTDIDFENNRFILDEPLSEFVSASYEVTIDLPGAYVKPPLVGRYEWIYDLDLTSLYPSIIMTLNISPETKVGRINNWNAQDFINKSVSEYDIDGTILTREQLVKYLDESKFSVASNGVLYRTDKVGCVPGILDLWFKKRVEYKDEMKKYGKLGNDEKYKFYHKRQLVQKILLNSLYGVLGLITFRFYDVDNAEAVTSTGQEVIKNTANMGNIKYNQEIYDKTRYKITFENGEEKEFRPTRYFTVKREGVEMMVMVKDLLETDEIIEV